MMIVLFYCFSYFPFSQPSLKFSNREPDFPDSLHPVMYKILEKFEILHTLKNQKAIES